MIQGDYALRFRGFSVANNLVYWLTGVGRLNFDGQGKVTGAHTSSSTAITGQGAEQKTADYELTGAYDVAENGLCTAEVKFRHLTITDQSADMTGGFRLVGVGDYSQLWLISTYGIIDSFPLVVDEVINGEAVRC